MDIVHQKPNYALPATQGAPLRTAGRGDDDADELAAQIRDTVGQVLGPDINMQQVMPMQMAPLSILVLNLVFLCLKAQEMFHRGVCMIL